MDLIVRRINKEHIKTQDWVRFLYLRYLQEKEKYKENRKYPKRNSAKYYKDYSLKILKLNCCGIAILFKTPLNLSYVGKKFRLES